MFSHLTILPTTWISLKNNPHILHFDVDADLVEWEAKMFTYIPDSFITGKQHSGKVIVEVGLCGCTKLSNDWFVTVVLKGAVILVYSLRWATYYTKFGVFKCF